MLRRSDFNFKGFTLVELIVTVAIVSVLASLAVSMFQEMRFKTLRGIMKSNLSNVYTHQNMFFQNWETYTPCFNVALGNMSVMAAYVPAEWNSQFGDPNIFVMGSRGFPPGPTDAANHLLDLLRKQIFGCFDGTPLCNPPSPPLCAYAVGAVTTPGITPILNSNFTWSTTTITIPAGVISGTRKEVMTVDQAKNFVTVWSVQ